MSHVQKAKLELETVPVYDPALCKTCQNQRVEIPRKARVNFSDCEEHFRRRVERLANTGVTILHKGKKFEPDFSEF